MKTGLIRVDIGIPAYNEELTIARVIADVLKQRGNEWVLNRIFVYSDGSTDQTNSIVKRISRQRIQLVSNPVRKGIATAINALIRQSSSDILILLDADIVIPSESFIQEFVHTFKTSPNIGLVGARVEPLPPKTFIESVLNESHRVKTLFYEAMVPHSIYLCHGRALGFRKKLYKKLSYPQIIADDAYAYVRTKEESLEFRYVKKATVQFRNPATITDHIKQSIRFNTGRAQIQTVFSNYDISAFYRLPVFPMIFVWTRWLLKRPVSAVTYLALYLYCAAAVKVRTGSIKNIWEISLSTKRI